MKIRIRAALFVIVLASMPALAFVQSGQKPDARAPSPKEARYAELCELARQIAESRADAAPEPRIEQLSTRYALLSRSLGGDDPAHLLGTRAPGAQSGGSAPHALVVPGTCNGASVTTTSVSGTGGPIAQPTPFGGVTFTTVVSGLGPYLWDVNLNTLLTHPNPADLDITLQSPAGTTVVISTDNGGNFDDVFNGTLWDDNANAPATDFLYTNLTTATPLSPEGSLSAFRGEDPNGTWTLTILDDAPGNVGNLAAWSLDIDTLASAPVEATSTFSNSPNLSILDVATVTDSMTLSGLPTYLDKVVLYVEILHTYAGDLDIDLISPNGTVVTVTTDNGGAADNVFDGTSFDPAALDTVTDHVYTNLVVVPLLSPEGSFANFLGQDPNGVWTLSITDDQAQDIGTLVRWDLSVTTTAPPSTLGSVNFAGVGGPVTDNQPPSTTPTIFTTSVSGAGSSLWDVDLTTFLTHTACGDIDMTLTSPTGTSVTISTDNGGINDDVYNGTLWDDEANAPVTDYPYTNLVLASPLSPEGRLAAFRGENPNGTWTLSITDDTLGDLGALGSWSLDLATVSAQPATAATTVSHTPNLTILSTVANTVTDTIPMSGLGTSIEKVEVYIEILHTYCADLDITLTSPFGTIVKLTTDNGGALDNVFDGTLFDPSVVDTVTDHAYTNLVVAPLLSPEGSFDDFLGQDPNGNWTLTVFDDTLANGGTFVRWDLTVHTCVSGPGTAFCDPGLAGVIACPCGNNPSGPGEGCSNSLGAGASISGSGLASLAADTLVVSASGIRSAGVSCAGNSPTLTCILLQGNATNPAGIQFNDGVRCFAGALKRIQTLGSVGGVFTSTAVISTTSAALGDPISAGSSRYYGVWYRDACASWGCGVPANSNVSNSYSVLWNP